MHSFDKPKFIVGEKATTKTTTNDNILVQVEQVKRDSDRLFTMYVQFVLLVV